MSSSVLLSPPLDCLMSRINLSVDAPHKISYVAPRSPLVFERDSHFDARSPRSPDFAALPDKSAFAPFIASKSSVVRLHGIPAPASSFLHSLFASTGPQGGTFPIPLTLWTQRPDYAGTGNDDSVWAVYRSHDEACAALLLSGSSIFVSPALEDDLKPFHKLQRFDITAPEMYAAHPQPNGISQPNGIHQPPNGLPQHCRDNSIPTARPLRLSSSTSDLRVHPRAARTPPYPYDAGYTMSSNPPNPRTMFRAGDWICSFANCAEHNFGRNLACRGCGCPRPAHGPHVGQAIGQPTRLPSPRFTTPGGQEMQFPDSPAMALSPTAPSYPYHDNASPVQTTFSPTQHQPKPAATHHLLTPSGRAISSGGRVQNISSDPLAPCVMYWPDNEPLPEQGQLRPSGLLGLPHPPILNTGNRGPIEHQPGDWICRKCNYLNWRRRKVCQTCYPYAEGNGDSISAAVQAVRMNNLSHLLTPPQNGAIPSGALPSPMQTSAPLRPMQQSAQVLHTSVPRMQSRSNPGPLHHAVPRAHSHVDLASQYEDASPIYQTSGLRQPTPHQHLSGASLATHAPSPVPGPLLPSFLQDIVQSPSLSPTSTSSADLSLDEYNASPTSIYSTQSQSQGSVQYQDRQIPRKASDSSVNNTKKSNIWRLDGEESKVLAGPALPTQGGLAAVGRKKSVEYAWA
ncbi:hypothetical protein DENSPDRAFT_840591 [Dentipellis sp. KUC8613]|nr:hypothetical protein DENSPDRAFT_840591 [Dentipellis sp. KUC8613]